MPCMLLILGFYIHRNSKFALDENFELGFQFFEMLGLSKGSVYYPFYTNVKKLGKLMFPKFSTCLWFMYAYEVYDKCLSEGFLVLYQFCVASLHHIHIG